MIYAPLYWRSSKEGFSYYDIMNSMIALDCYGYYGYFVVLWRVLLLYGGFLN